MKTPRLFYKIGEIELLWYLTRFSIFYLVKLPRILTIFSSYLCYKDQCIHYFSRGRKQHPENLISRITYPEKFRSWILMNPLEIKVDTPDRNDKYGFC